MNSVNIEKEAQAHQVQSNHEDEIKKVEDERDQLVLLMSNLKNQKELLQEDGKRKDLQIEKLSKVQNELDSYKEKSSREINYLID